jgi:ABC-2 type transport system permease protein
MGAIYAIFKREFKSYFSTSMGYVILVVFLVLAGFLTIKGRFLEMRQADLRVFFDNLPLLFMFFVPAAGMRLWAEEHKSGTIEFLFSLPVTVPQAVIGKFLAAWLFLGVALALTAPTVITVAYLGRPDTFAIVTGYLGAILLGGAYLAVSSFCSAFTRSQIVSFVLSIAVISLFVYADSPAFLAWMAGRVPAFLIEAVANMSVVGHFESMQRGVLEFRDLTYYGLLISGLVAMTCIVVDHRRESC